MTDSASTFYAFLGGTLPAILWLLFWLREDSKRPEPRGRLVETFLAGMLVVILVIPLQKYATQIHPVDPEKNPFSFFFPLALLEEIFKFLAAYVIALRSIDDDEPIDSIIYMITAALGFVALENALFILNPLLKQDITLALVTGGSRFLGASILHTIASGAMGVMIALSFYKAKKIKIRFALLGLLIAILVHTAFNVFLYRNIGENADIIFMTVWIGAAMLLLLFEKVKTIAP